jgi:hypothetical protein
VAQTPVVRYENRKSGRTVTLIATMHSGTNAYFNKLNEIIAGLEATGALVCYEGIRPAAEEEWARAADGERAARGLSVPVNALQAVCRYLGWVEQSAGLKYSPSWRNVDITELELVRQAQPHCAWLRATLTGTSAASWSRNAIATRWPGCRRTQMPSCCGEAAICPAWPQA